MSESYRRARFGLRLLWPCVGASLALTVLGLGPASVAPLAVFALLVFVACSPLEWSALGLLAVALLVDNPGERPMEGKWESPLLPLGDLLYNNLNKVTGIEALRFSLLEAAIGVLLVVAIARRVHGDRIDEPTGTRTPRHPMRGSWALMLGAIVALEMWGLARHGDFKNSLWQFRQLIWMPALGVLFGYSLKSAASRVALVRIVLAVACVRALLGIWFHFAICVPQDIVTEYATTHSDAILATVAILLGLVLLVAQPCPEHTWLNAVVQPIVVLGMLVNDRRIAFVGIAGGIAALVLLSPPALQRKLKRASLLLAPVIALYVGVGWFVDSPVFGPVATLRSVITQDDDSSKTRDIENFNLIQTLKRQPLFGSGFGHEYIEFVQANRVDQIFAQYRFIAHNSVLWLLSLSGIAGFTLVWQAFAVSASVALRAFRAARVPMDRVAAFGAVAALCAFIVQAWGDMGLQSWMGTLLLTAFVGAAGALSVPPAPEHSFA